METKIQSDVGEEIISRLKEIIERLNKILAMRNEKEYQNPLLDRIRN